MQAPDLHVLTLALSLECDRCNGSVPINGPTRTPVCPGCQTVHKLTRLHEELVLANEGYTILGSPYKALRVSQAGPECSKCEAQLPIHNHLTLLGQRAQLPCGRCGTPIPTYPAPAWLREQLPQVQQIFGGDAEIAAGEAGLPLRVEQTSPQPIAMACPQCGAGLSIRASDERVVPCRFCSTSVFLPDELWRKLHPVKIARTWSVVYEGRLVSQSTLEQEQEEREERAREARAAAEERAAEARKAELQRIEHEQRLREHAAYMRRMYAIIALSVLSTVGVALWSVLRHGHP